MAESNNDGDVQIRVVGAGGEATFLRLHSDDTLSTLADRIVSMSTVTMGSWANQDWFLIDNGSHPPRLFSLEQRTSTLYKLGLWPGGSVRVSLEKSLVAGGVTTKGDSEECNMKRPAPSELLSSHFGRFDHDPIIAPAAKFNVQGSGSIPVVETGEQGSAVVAKVVGRAEKATTKAGKAVAETTRRMVIKKRAVGRANLAMEERFFVEVRVPMCNATKRAVTTESPTTTAAANPSLPIPSSSSAATAAAPTVSVVAEEGSFFFLYWPCNWPLGKALDDTAERLRAELRRAAQHLSASSSSSLSSSAAPQLVPFVERTGVALTDPHLRSRHLRELDQERVLAPFDVVTFLSPCDVAAMQATTSNREGAESRDTSPLLPPPPDEVHGATGGSCDSSAPPGVGSDSTDDAADSRGAESSGLVGGSGGWSLTVKHGKSVYEVKGLDPLSDTVGDLKDRVAALSGVGDASKIKLLYKGLLNDDTAALGSTKLKNGSKATMM